ncbi:SUMF1/EgtB/PvdO family nonheme iron enzyme [Pseudactinotalea suaedae]|uniref:SUMF1/EgtB/PvdO family nonheme iron enzyme n=1 Tax=Pseudactinotalea suaedae TaxID=1524924 RepID=UPI0012E30AF4|nr:SUMF1/EgtB/PvdO family nonheme iron enzyme [Pseudactinotalea suaedae]
MTDPAAASPPVASFDPLVPRPIDLPTAVPASGDLAALDEAKIFSGPASPADRPAWRARLADWREEARRRLDYRGEAYEEPGAAWAQRCFTVAQVWLWDELFFDFEEQRFTPERFLEDARTRFGGLDGLVLWHAYPVIGIDDRNQWDFYRDVPGLTAVVQTLHEHGVAVFVDYNPWDVGTRRGREDRVELAELVRDLGADGVFLDTLKKADPELVAALQEARPGFVLEGESKLALERISDHAASWAQWFADSEVPGVLRAHWFERRHMQHHIRRWHRDHSEELASAWLNGVGIMVWEVVFGVWVGWSARDAATLRRMLPVQRGFSEALVQGEWTPLADIGAAAEEARVYGSLFSHDGLDLLLLANRSDVDVAGPLPGDWTPLHTGGVPARGVAAYVSMPDGEDSRWREVVDQVRGELSDVAHEPDAAFPHRRARRLPAPAPTGARREDLATAAVVVPAGEHVLTVRYRARETGMYEGAPYVDEWKPLPPRLHDQRTLERAVTLAHDVRVATREVTVSEMAEFLGTGERGDGPATGVTLAQARAYAASVGGRLPTEDEWQLAAGLPGFERLTPAVWSWTESEHSDGRTRFVMLKGGSEHRSEGSDWYTDGGVRAPEFSLKFLLPGLGGDASPSIGFRVCWEES